MTGTRVGGSEVITLVTTAAPSQDLVSLANLKADLEISHGTEDTYLRRRVSVVSDEVAGYCNRVFIQETVKETFTVRRYHNLTYGEVEVLLLTRYPVASITSITERGVLLDPTVPDYKLDADKGLLTRLTTPSPTDPTLPGSPRPWLSGDVIVTYAGGYSSSAVPLDLQDAVTRIIKGQRAARTRDPLLRQVSVAGVAEEQYWVGVNGLPEFPSDVIAMLDRKYRVPKV